LLSLGLSMQKDFFTSERVRPSSLRLFLHPLLEESYAPQQILLPFCSFLFSLERFPCQSLLPLASLLSQKFFSSACWSWRSAYWRWHCSLAKASYFWASSLFAASMRKDSATFNRLSVTFEVKSKTSIATEGLELWRE